MAKTILPLSSDIYLEADGKKVAVVQSYTTKAVRTSREIEAFGESEPVATIAGEREKSTAAGASAAVRGEESFVRAAARESGGTETLALSLERDARRYDGGFLFY